MSSPESVEPLARFHAWLDEAMRASEVEYTRMALATVDAAGNPQVRMVLLKQADERGFVFYTNLTSPKSAELGAHPVAALCFYWTTTRKQVRVHGRVEPVSEAEADAYFATRARLSQIGAWASRQSTVMRDALELERACATVALRHALEAVPRPSFWSGFRVVPTQFEFWSEKPFRRHERLRYTLENGAWKTDRLFP